jgi:hypothetical protein
MKLTKILMCAVAAGAMAFVSSNAQAVVIGNNLFTPINVKATFSYVASAGKIKQASLTSKQILTYLGNNYYTVPTGAQLAVGPDNDIYLIDTKNQSVIDDLSFTGFFYFYPDSYVDTSTYGLSGTYKSYEAGIVTFNFYSDANYGIPDENDYSFIWTGNYTYNETDTVDNSNSIYTKTSTFSSKNLGGWGYNFDVSGSSLPVSGSASGSASGKIVD